MVDSSLELWLNAGMKKQQAIELLGGTIAAAARAIGVTYQAVDKWPDDLPDRIADRVQAYLYRQQSSEVATTPTPGA